MDFINLTEKLREKGEPVSLFQCNDKVILYIMKIFCRKPIFPPKYRLVSLPTKMDICLINEQG